MKASVSVTRVQAYLRSSAQQESQTIAIPPFTLFLRSGDAASADNHAVPDEPLADSAHEPLAKVREAFEARAQHTRIRFLAEFAPQLVTALRAEDMVEERCEELLACTPDALILPPDVPGLRMVTLDANAALADVREGLDTNERGFDPRAEPVSDTQAQVFRTGLVTSRAFIARINGAPAGAGMFNPPYAGVTELVGIASVEPFRRQGVAAYLTAYAARIAFQRGVELVFLRTDNAAARRVYERVGFHAYATLYSYVDPLSTR